MSKAIALAVIKQAREENLTNESDIVGMSDACLDSYIQERMYVPEYSSLVYAEDRK